MPKVPPPSSGQRDPVSTSFYLRVKRFYGVVKSHLFFPFFSSDAFWMPFMFPVFVLSPPFSPLWSSLSETWPIFFHSLFPIQIPAHFRSSRFLPSPSFFPLREKPCLGCVTPLFSVFLFHFCGFFVEFVSRPFSAVCFAVSPFFFEWSAYRPCGRCPFALPTLSPRLVFSNFAC